MINHEQTGTSMGDKPGIADQPVAPENLSSALEGQSANVSFSVSLDEEHVSLALEHGGVRWHFGEHVHHYAVLVLARRRVADARQGIDSSSQGWIDNQLLSRMLGIEPGCLTIQIFRLRRQLATARPSTLHLAAMVERRRGQSRFGAHAVAIFRGSVRELPPVEADDAR